MSTLFVDTEYVPDDHLTLCVTPSILTDVGEYPVAPCDIIIVAVIALLFVVGILVKLAE